MYFIVQMLRFIRHYKYIAVLCKRLQTIKGGWMYPFFFVYTRISYSISCHLRILYAYFNTILVMHQNPVGITSHTSVYCFFRFTTIQPFRIYYFELIDAIIVDSFKWFPLVWIQVNILFMICIYFSFLCSISHISFTTSNNQSTKLFA